MFEKISGIPINFLPELQENSIMKVLKGESLELKTETLDSQHRFLRATNSGVWTFAAIRAALFTIPLKVSQDEQKTLTLFSILCSSLAMQPLSVLQTQKKIMAIDYHMISYSRLWQQYGFNTMIIGVDSLVLRNVFLMAPLISKDHGFYTAVAFTIGGIVASHPFEVSRILTVADPQNPLANVGSLFNAQGYEGIFRGLTPRMITLFPLVLAANMLNSYEYRSWRHRQDTIARAPAVNTHILL
jgi:hypothetical protein